MYPYCSPKYRLDGFNCPHCGAFSNQIWYLTGKLKNLPTHNYPINHAYDGIFEGFEFAECNRCHNYSLWFDKKMIFPFSGNAPLPNPDLPEEIMSDYIEAKNIVSLSPRGAAALLRLIVQKICQHLGEKGANINEDIGNLVKKGLPQKLQKALDSVRVIGNNAVHPGHLDFKDDIETAEKLFNFVNIICDVMISQPKKIDEFYEEKMPEIAKRSIEKRDSQ